ncbi:class I SAM-dependent methyltransferase [Bacillus sp. REN3]|uniref:class I SAM-dependent methyltransferase n=1 Tax=Bacillus sp. REN3 TaxID=2802440 RepID=UPI001AED20A3|nr:class I SAM-dependent methyltransferase [Bacillus sp. REN3]
MNEKENVQIQFGKNAGNYVTSTAHAEGADLAELVEIVKNHRTRGSILDIATGGGHVANALAPLAEVVIAYDITEKMLEKAEEFIHGNGHRNVKFVCGDAENLSFPDSSFDIVTCRIAAHHFPHVERFVQEVFRVLKAGGLFILVDNVAPELEEYDEFYNAIEKKRDPSHFRAHKKSKWITFVESAGMQVRSMRTFVKKFQYEIWCARMALPADDKNELSTYMKDAAKDIRDHFSLEVNESGQIEGFIGESILLASVKK